MRKLFFLVLLISSIDAFSHGGDDGPSSLEDQFSKTSHLHLPVSYSSMHGLSSGFHIGESHTDELPDHDHEDTHGDETGLEVNIHPQVAGGFDKITRFINQEESESNSEVIEASDPSTPFIQLVNKKWDLGLGLEIETHLPNPLWVAGVGLSYLKGKNYYTKRVLKNRSEKRSSLELPVSSEALSSWRLGDELAYASKGSIIFNIIIGIDPIIHFGPLYSHTGTFRYKVRLEDEETIEVEVTTMTSDSISIEGSAIVLDADAGKTRGISKSIKYDFDLTNPESFKAMDALFRGRLDITNDMLMKSGGSIHLKTDLFNFGTYFTGSFGLPVIYFNGMGRGTYVTSGTIEDDENNKLEVYSTTSQKENYTKGVASRRKWENQSIVSTVINGETSILSSVFSWSYSLDKANDTTLMKKFRKLADVFGIEKLKYLSFPQRDLGYVKADFNMNLSGRDVLDLLHGKELNDLKAKALEKLEADFHQYGHREFCRIRTYANCLDRYKNLITNKAMTIRKLRNNIETSYKSKNFALVTRDLSQITKTLFSSRYLTEAFLASNKSVLKELRLEGERIKKHKFQGL